MDRDHDTRLAAYAVVVDDEDRVLLALWNEAEPAWTLPGGGVDLDETPAEGAVREVREETGYDVRLTGLLDVATVVRSAEERLGRHDKPLKSVGVIYAAEVVGGTLTAEVDGTTDEARWFPLAEVAGLPRVALVDAGLDAWRTQRSPDSPA